MPVDINALVKALREGERGRPVDPRAAALAEAFGIKAPGNIDLMRRPVVKNQDGTISTVRSMSVNIDGEEVLIPTVSDDGRILSDQAAIDLYRHTGRHLGRFRTPQGATQFAERLHEQQARAYSP